MSIRPPASLTRPVATDLVHVTVRAPRRRVDLALPGTVPILEFTALLANLCQAGDAGQRETTPPVWTLARAASGPFDLTTTLAAQGVLDGEVLHLVDVSRWRAPSVTDVADAVTEEQESGLRWTSVATAWLASGLALTCFLVAVSMAAASGAVDGGAGLLALAGAAGLLGLATALPAISLPALGDRRPPQLALAAGGAVLSGLAFWGLAGAHRDEGGLLAAALGLMVGMLAASAAAPAVGPGGALASGALALAAIAIGWGAVPAGVAAVAAVLGVIGLRAVPALAGGGRPSPAARPDPVAARATARRWRRLRASLVAGTAAIVLGAAMALAVSGRPYAVGLAALCGAALLLRAQACRHAAEALPPALAGAAVLLVLDVAVTDQLLAGGTGPAALALPVATALGLAALSAVRTRPLAAPSVRLSWLVVNVALAPLALGALGVFDLLLLLVHRLVH